MQSLGYNAVGELPTNLLASNGTLEAPPPQPTSLFHWQYTKGGYAIILYLSENKHLRISFIPAFYSFNMNV